MPARRSPERPTELAPAIDLGGSRVLVGTCSWTDRTLVNESDWYPRRSMTAAERLAFYASQFPVVEADSTYYFPPTPEMSASCVERTPRTRVPDPSAGVSAHSSRVGSRSIRVVTRRALLTLPCR